MARDTSLRPPRGLTVLELLVAMAAMLVVIALVVRAMIGLQHDQALRQKVSALQTNARQALSIMTWDLRHASLGTGSGVVWTGAGVRRPAVQIFTSIGGGSAASLSDAKPGTDALLVVEAAPASAERTVAVTPLSSSFLTLTVSDASAFHADDTLLVGDYGDASWGRVSAVNTDVSPNQITLAAQAVVPGAVSQLGTGALVRGARARLFYVTTADELVRLTVTDPRAPLASEVVDRAVLSPGVENLQLDCQLDDTSGGFVACSDATNPAPVLVGDPITTEAVATFGAFGTGGGPRLTAANVGLLRAVVVQIALRSPTPLADGAGDAPIPIYGTLAAPAALGPGAATGMRADALFPRRAYRVTTAVRNTSLWSF
jgi:type II secretory pathway pseudopilin PulG